MSGRPSGPPPGPAPGVRAAALALLVLAVTLPVVPLRPVTRASEARAWVVARTMAETGDLLVPAYLGEPRLKKPPLASWLQAGALAASRTRGPAAAGLVSALAAVLAVLGTAALGRALGRGEAGLVGAALLAASRATGVWGPSPEHDVLFAAAGGGALVALARTLGAAGRPRDALLAGLCTGLALLTKSPFVPGLVLLTAAVARARAPGPVAARPFWGGLGLGTLLPGALWVGALALRLGSVGALFDEALAQATGAEGAHRRPFLEGLVYPVGSALKAGLPWGPVVLGLALALAVRGRRRPDDRAALRAVPGLAALASAVGLGLLVVTPAKQEHYVLPVLVPLAVLAGHVVEVAAARLPGGRRAVPAALGASAVVYAATRLVAGHAALARADLGPSLGAVAGLGLAGGLLLVCTRCGRARAVTAAVAAAALGLGGVADAARGLEAEDLRDAWATAARAPGGGAVASWAAADGAGPRDGVTVVGFEEGGGEAFDTLVAWTRAPYVRVRRAEDLAGVLAARAPCVVVVRAPNEARLAAAAPGLVRLADLAPPRPGSPRDRYALFGPAR